MMLSVIALLMYPMRSSMTCVIDSFVRVLVYCLRFL